MGNSGAIVVTGGSRGIGAAICKRLAADGYKVVVNFARDANAAAGVVQAIVAAGGHAIAHQADMADPTQIGGMFETAERELGPLAGLVANAGVLGEARRLEAHDAASLSPVFAVNVIGLMLCAGEAVRRLSPKHGGQGGGIVAISSIAARNGGIPGMVAYAASKGAVESFAKSLANEVAREGIRVNAVAPGMIETDMTAGVAQQIAPMIPVGRCGQPDEIAAAVAWLLSDATSYVTGTTLTVSGGR